MHKQYVIVRPKTLQVVLMNLLAYNDKALYVT